MVLTFKQMSSQDELYIKQIAYAMKDVFSNVHLQYFSVGSIIYIVNSKRWGGDGNQSGEVTKFYVI